MGGDPVWEGVDRDVVAALDPALPSWVRDVIADVVQVTTAVMVARETPGGPWAVDEVVSATWPEVDSQDGRPVWRPDGLAPEHGGSGRAVVPPEQRWDLPDWW